MKFLRAIIQAYRAGTLLWIYNPGADEDGIWTQEDSENLKNFFNSLTGTKFKMQLANYYVRCSMEANKTWTDHVRHLGIAFGVWLVLQFIENRAKDVEFRQAQAVNMAQFKISEPSAVADDLALL